MTSFYRDLAQPAMIALARAGNRGCRIDTTLREKLAAEAKEAAEVAVVELEGLLGKPLNPNSPKQVKKLLYEDLGLPVQHSKPSGGFRGKVTTDEEAIAKLIRLAPQHEKILGCLLDYRGAVKRTAMLEIILEPRDGDFFFVTSYNATGTKTGRVSSSTTLLGYGGNLQNQKRGASRRIFIPRKGMIFVKADGSQAESRVTAALCKDQELLDRFASPEFDIHIENAGFIYGGTKEELQAEDKKMKALGKDSKRERAKKVTHAANYMGGPRVAVKHANVPYAEAKMAIAKYKAAHPLLLKWWDRVDVMLRTTRTLRTTWGRLRIFLNRVDQTTLRAAVAFEPQSTVGDLINRAFFRLSDALWPAAWPLLQVHDEIVCEVKKGEEGRVIDLMRKEFEVRMKFEGVAPLSIPAELATGDNWYDLEKVT